MTGFVAAAASIVAFVLALLLRPFFWKTHAVRSLSRRQMNANVYRDQLAKLDQDLAEGVLGQDDHAQSRDELQRRVLQDMRGQEAAATLRAPRKTMFAVGVAIPLAAFGLYLLLGNPGGVTMAAGGAPKPGTPDIASMVAALSQKLEQDPGNLQGWAMLARAYKAMGRVAEAQKAYERAGAFLDNDAQLLAEYADVIATNANGDFSGKPMQLIDKALKVDPQNPMALWMAGTAVLSRRDYEGAIRVWERLAKLLPPDSQDARNLQDAIDEVRSMATKNGSEAIAVAANGGANVTGTVELDVSLKAKAAPGDTVMVIARMPGMRMPVAVLRASVAQLPLKFTLDDSLAMSPQMRISAAREVEVEARISKSGLAKAEPGDLISAARTVKVGSRDVTLHVGQVRP